MDKINRPKSKQPLPKDAEKVFDGEIFDVYQYPVKQFDGSTATFEKLKRPDTALVLPITDEGKILLTEQEQPTKDRYQSFLGGRIDEEDESVLNGAKRELLEESGYQASTWELWFSCQPISKIEWAIYYFVAKDLKKTSEPKLDPGEKIDLKAVTFDEFVTLATQEDFTDPYVSLRVFQAKHNPKEMRSLKKLFRP